MALLQGVFVSMREHARHSSLSVLYLLPRGFQRLMQEDENLEAILRYVVRLSQTIYVNCTGWYGLTVPTYNSELCDDVVRQDLSEVRRP